MCATELVAGMTAVQMAVVGRRYAISGEGYSTVGQITHVAGQPHVPLDELLLPMALCADAEVKDGVLLGRLKASDGAFTYRTEAPLDPAEFRSVVIHCVAFRTIFSVATLS